MGTNKVHPDPPVAPPSPPRESSSDLVCTVLFVIYVLLICYVAIIDTKCVKEYRITSVISNNATTWNISVQYLLVEYPYSVPPYTSFQVLLFNNNNSNDDDHDNSLIAESAELFTPYSLMSSDPITLTNKKKIRGGFDSDSFEIGIWFKYNRAIGNTKGSLLVNFFCANFTVVFNKNITSSGGLIASDVPKEC